MSLDSSFNALIDCWNIFRFVFLYFFSIFVVGIAHCWLLLQLLRPLCAFELTMGDLCGCFAVRVRRFSFFYYFVRVLCAVGQSEKILK